MITDNIQHPCVQPSTSSYNPPLPHGCHGHHCCHGHGGHDGHGGRNERGGQGGQDRTGLTFKLDFPGNL